MNLTEYLPHTFLYSNSWAVLYYKQTNQINSNSPVIVYVSKGDIITLKGTICRNMWLIWLWVTLWRLKTNRRQPQVGHLFFNLHVNQDTFDSSTAFLWLDFTPISQADAPTSTYTHTLHLPVRVLVVDVESLGGAQQLWKKIEKEGEQREEMEKDH